MRKKEKLQLVIIGVIIAVTVLFLRLRENGDSEKARIWIDRPESGISNRKISLHVMDTEEELTLPVEARVKSEEEIDAAFSETIRILNEILIPQSGEKMVITQSLSLPRYIEETGVDIRWESSDNTVLSKEGNVHREGLKEPCEILLQARMNLDGEYREQWFTAEVLPYEPGSREALLYGAEEALKELEEKTSAEDGFYLPDEIGPVRVGISKKTVSAAGVIAAAVLILPAVIIVAKQREKEKEKQKRDEELLAAYPGLVTKLTLYAGAGLSLRGSWERLAAEYRKKAEDSGKKDTVGEEVMLLAGELRNGTPEARAYETFGRRIGLKPYLRCASLLVSQLQKGSGGLREGLEQEVGLAWEMHRERAVKKGEEAQTKMLFPMMGMLLLVMAVVMIPAFFSM